MSAPQSLAEPATEPHPAPLPLQMVQLLAGFQVSQARYAAAKLGVADQLRAELKDATAVGAEAQSLRHLLRALASVGSSPRPRTGGSG